MNAPPITPAATVPYRRSWPLASVLALLLLAFASYWRVLDGEFQYDDTHTIERSMEVRDLTGAIRSMVEGLGSGTGTERSLVNLTFALDYAIGGLSPRGFHVTSLLLHLAAAVVIFLLGQRLARIAGVSSAEWVAVAAAGLFALHPVQSGAVSYITQRSEVLASLLYATSFLLLLVAEEAREAWRERSAYAGALLAFVLGLSAKAIVLTMPVMYLLAMVILPSPVARRGFWGARRRVALLSPFLIVAGVFALRTLGSITGPGAGPDAGFSVPGLPPYIYALTQLRVLFTYVRLLLVPMGQSVDWEFAASRSLLDPPTTMVAGIALVAILTAAVLAWRRSRGSEEPWAGAVRVAAFGVAWFFVLLSPTSSFVPLADVLMEHRLYLASWGLFLAAACALERGAARIEEGRRARVVVAAFVAVACLQAGLLHERNAVWETRAALWSDAMRKAPEKGRPRAQLALAYQEAGRLDEALDLYASALERFRATDGFSEVQARRNLATALVASGRAQEAVGVLERAMALEPGNPEIATNLALAFLQIGDLDGAQRWIDLALARRPDLPEAQGLRGSILLRRGDAAGAEEAFAAASRLAPEAAAHAYNHGVALERMERFPEACSEWERALRLKGDPVLAEKIPRKLSARCR